MPIRPIDPTKRALYAKPPVTTPVVNAPAAPGHQPQALAADLARDEQLIVVDPRVELKLTRKVAGKPSVSPVKPGGTVKRAHHIVDKTGPNWDENGDYAVGKNRPPVHTRWQKGQSGNPRGPKTKEVVDPQTAFDNMVLADFTAKVNGEEVTLNMGTFVVQLLKAGAAKGGVQEKKALLELFLTTLARRVGHPALPAIDDGEQKIIDELLAGLDLSANPVFRKVEREGGEDVS